VYGIQKTFTVGEALLISQGTAFLFFDTLVSLIDRMENQVL
jgi:hypothetical protein